MYFAAFSRTVITKQRGKRMLAWWRKWTAVQTKIKNMNTVQRGQSNSGSDQTIETSVKAP